MTGVDISPGSLEYARQAAAEAGLSIEFIEGDYRALDEDGEYDAAILVYLDFGVLSDADRRLVLAGVRDWVRPKGRFAFDVVEHGGDSPGLGELGRAHGSRVLAYRPAPGPGTSTRLPR